MWSWLPNAPDYKQLAGSGVPWSDEPVGCDIRWRDERELNQQHQADPLTVTMWNPHVLHTECYQLHRKYIIFTYDVLSARLCIAVIIIMWVQCHYGSWSAQGPSAEEWPCPKYLFCKTWAFKQILCSHVKVLCVVFFFFYGKLKSKLKLECTFVSAENDQMIDN